jgi:putative heme-binding domain-containing protein
LNALATEDLLAAMSDAEPHVRAAAVQLAEYVLAQRPHEQNAQLVAALVARARDEAVRVRFQTAFTLEVLGEAGLPALAEISCHDPDNPWVRAAVLSSTGGRESALAGLLWRQRPFPTTLMRELAFLIGAGGEQRALRAFLSELERQLARAEQAAQAAALDSRPGVVRRADVQAVMCGLAGGLSARGTSLIAAASELGADAERLVRQSMEAALDMLSHPSSTVEERVAAIELVAYHQEESVIEILAALLVPQELPAVQFAALRALAARSEPAVAQRLLQAYPALTPGVRGELLLALAARPERTEALMAALEQGAVGIRDLSPALRARLLNHPDEALRERAARLLAAQALGPRSEVLAVYTQALRLAADAAEGRRVFRRECASCHRLQGEGHAVGPDLAAIRHRTPEELLVHILDPNREVAPEFTAYVVVQLDGRLATGLVAAETATSLTLRRAEGQEETILRENIESLTTAGSLMPEGIEQRISPAEMAHLLAYLLGK